MATTSNHKYRKRNHAAEYQRRLARGRAKGLTKAQARGHGAFLTARSSAKKASLSEQRFLEKGVKLIRSGSSLTAAAKHLHVAPERLRNYLTISGIAKKKGSRWRVTPDDRSRQMLMFSKGRELKLRVEIEAASLIGSYMNDVGLFLRSNNITFLRVWDRKSVIDIKGRKHPFETNPNSIYELNLPGRNSFDDIYRILT